MSICSLLHCYITPSMVLCVCVVLNSCLESLASISNHFSYYFLECKVMGCETSGFCLPKIFSPHLHISRVVLLDIKTLKVVHLL